MADPLTIRNHILTTILAHGGDWEEVEDALFEALLPRKLAARLNVSPETWRFTFDPEVKAEEPDADLMVFGNPILDRLLDFGVEKGGVSEVCISGMYLDDPRIPTQVEKAITVAGGDLSLGDSRPCNVRFARFLFQVTFLTDVREEELRSVTVNLTTGELERRLETVLPNIALAPFPQQGIPDAPTISVVDAYLTARIEILRQMTSPYRELTRALKRRQREEKRRIQAFHEGYRDEQESLKERYGKYPERVAVIDAKIESSRIEGEHRIAELARKYRAETFLRLRSILSIVQPMVYVDCALVRDGETFARITPKWDPRERRVGPASCPVCGELAYSFSVGPGPRNHNPVRCARCI